MELLSIYKFSAIYDYWSQWNYFISNPKRAENQMSTLGCSLQTTLTGFEEELKWRYGRGQWGCPAHPKTAWKERDVEEHQPQIIIAWSPAPAHTGLRIQGDVPRSCVRSLRRKDLRIHFKHRVWSAQWVLNIAPGVNWKILQRSVLHSFENGNTEANLLLQWALCLLSPEWLMINRKRIIWSKYHHLYINYKGALIHKWHSEIITQ